MPKISTAPFTQNHRLALTSLTSSDGNVGANPGVTPTGTKLLVQAGTDGSIVKSINVCSNDNSPRNLSIFLSKDSGATKYLISSLQITIIAGSNGTTLPINVLALSTSFGVQGMPSDQTGSPVIYLGPEDSLYVGLLTTSMAAGRNMYITTVIEDF
jgi:hypothetical protein